MGAFVKLPPWHSIAAEYYNRLIFIANNIYLPFLTNIQRCCIY